MDEKKAPKKLNIVLRILAFLVTLALIAGAIFLVANRDKLSLDAVKRYFTYRSLERSDSGQAESFDYSPSATDVFASVGNDLLVASTGCSLRSETICWSPPPAAYVFTPAAACVMWKMT